MAGANHSLAWGSSFEIGDKNVMANGGGSTDGDCTLVNDSTKARSGDCFLEFAVTLNASYRTISVTARDHLLGVCSLYFQGGLGSRGAGTIPIAGIPGHSGVELRSANGNWWWTPGGLNANIGRVRVFRDSVSLSSPAFDSNYFREGSGGGDTGVAIVADEWYTIMVDCWSIDGVAKPDSFFVGGQNGYGAADATKKVRADDVSIWQNAPTAVMDAPKWAVKKPSVIGACDAWSQSPAAGNKYDKVNEAAPPDDDTTYIYSSAQFAQQTFKFGGSGLAGGTNILGLSLWGRCRLVSGTNAGSLVLRFSDGDKSANFLATAYANIRVSTSVSGANAPITLSEVDSNLEIGVVNGIGGVSERRCSFIVLEIIYAAQPTERARPLSPMLV